MRIGAFNIQPICIYLPDDPKWIERRQLAEKYFSEQGITDIMWVCGIHAERFGIQACIPYDRDPQNIETGWCIPQKTLGCTVSHFMLYNIMLSHKNITHWMILECDALFVDGWMDRLTQALNDTPKDFDWMFAGHCCCQGRETKHIRGEVYEVKYPLCGHFSIVASKSLPTIIETTKKGYYPIDVSLFDYTFPKLQGVYTIMPSLAGQRNTELPL